jgi:hypothetical protein
MQGISFIMYHHRINYFKAAADVCVSLQKGNSSRNPVWATTTGLYNILAITTTRLWMREYRTENKDRRWRRFSLLALALIQPIGPLDDGPCLMMIHTYKACIMKVFIMLKMHSRTVLMCTERENPPPTWAERNVIKCGWGTGSLQVKDNIIAIALKYI